MSQPNQHQRRTKKQAEGGNFPGQHLMHNKRLIQKLVKMSGVNRQDRVLEIGAGAGALTLPLSEQAGKVWAVENDPVLAEKLHKKVGQKSNIQIIQRDFLQMNLPRRPFCVVANIPYSITTPILGKLFDQPTLPVQRAVLVVERGAAKRFTADPITNPRILKWRMWFEVKMKGRIEPGNFSPPPRVDSAILTFWRKEKPLVPLRHHARFMRLARVGLKFPQSSVFEALRGVFTPPQLKHLMKNLGVDREEPIAFLTEEQWGVVFHTMFQYVEPYRWPK